MRRKYIGKKIHFIGVGGISMSALIRIAEKLGATTSGSDRNESDAYRSLEEEGFDVYLGSRPERAAEADVTVYTAAIKEDDAERMAAGEKAIPRSEFLSDICILFGKTIAVAGTHGKTTVSAMIASCLAAGGASFSAHIGGVARNFDSNTFLSGDEIFVTEACEYRDSFLTLSPDVEIILNIEQDHSDYFTDLESIRRSFSRFLSRVRKGGFAVLGKGVSSQIDRCAYHDITIYAYEEDFRFERVDEGGFRLLIKGEPPRFFMTSVKGEHNLYNAAVAAFVALKVGLKEDAIRMGLAGFLGVGRRYERMGHTAGGAPVVQDYAHHPSEIEAVLKVAREETTGRVILVFEPHTYSRTKALFARFVDVLARADVLVILPTYSAREIPAEGVDAKTLFCAISTAESYYLGTYESAKILLDRIARSEDEVLLLGAGSISELAKMFR